MPIEQATGFYGIAFIGGWIEQIGGFAGSQAAKRLASSPA
jgi:hypothetical protein